MYLLLWAGVLGTIFCAIGMTLIVKGRSDTTGQSILCGTYWFAAAAAIVAAGIIALVVS